METTLDTAITNQLGVRRYKIRNMLRKKVDSLAVFMLEC